MVYVKDLVEVFVEIGSRVAVCNGDLFEVIVEDRIYIAALRYQIMVRFRVRISNLNELFAELRGADDARPRRVEMP